MSTFCNSYKWLLAVSLVGYGFSGKAAVIHYTSVNYLVIDWRAWANRVPRGVSSIVDALLLKPAAYAQRPVLMRNKPSISFFLGGFGAQDRWGWFSCLHQCIAKNSFFAQLGIWNAVGSEAKCYAGLAYTISSSRQGLRTRDLDLHSLIHLPFPAWDPKVCIVPEEDRTNKSVEVSGLRARIPSRSAYVGAPLLPSAAERRTVEIPFDTVQKKRLNCFTEPAVQELHRLRIMYLGLESFCERNGIFLSLLSEVSSILLNGNSKLKSTRCVLGTYILPQLWLFAHQTLHTACPDDLGQFLECSGNDAMMPSAEWPNGLSTSRLGAFVALEKEIVALQAQLAKEHAESKNQSILSSLAELFTAKPRPSKPLSELLSRDREAVRLLEDTRLFHSKAKEMLLKSSFTCPKRPKESVIGNIESCIQQVYKKAFCLLNTEERFSKWYFKRIVIHPSLTELLEPEKPGKYRMSEIQYSRSIDWRTGLCKPGVGEKPWEGACDTTLSKAPIRLFTQPTASAQAFSRSTACPFMWSEKSNKYAPSQSDSSADELMVAGPFFKRRSGISSKQANCLDWLGCC